MAEVKKAETEKVVKIMRAEIMESQNVAATIFKKLEDAGIPIISSLPLGRIKSGVLTSKEDAANDCYIYEWQA